VKAVQPAGSVVVVAEDPVIAGGVVRKMCQMRKMRTLGPKRRQKVAGRADPRRNRIRRVKATEKSRRRAHPRAPGIGVARVHADEGVPVVHVKTEPGKTVRAGEIDPRKKKPPAKGSSPYLSFPGTRPVMSWNR
jgi:hypothetical protein